MSLHLIGMINCLSDILSSKEQNMCVSLDVSVKFGNFYMRTVFNCCRLNCSWNSVIGNAIYAARQRL